MAVRGGRCTAELSDDPPYAYHFKDLHTMKKSLQAKQLDSLAVSELGLVTPGVLVRHPFFGNGRVVALFEFPNGENSIGIEFESVGYKAISPEYGKLQMASSAVGSTLMDKFRRLLGS